MAPILLPEATAIHAIPSCCDCFQAWRPYALGLPPDLEAPFHFPESCNPDSTRQLAMEQPAGRTPPQGICSLCLALLPSNFVTFLIPLSTLGALSPAQAPGLDNSTPCLDFCPGFFFCPASCLLPSCPPVFISFLTREQGALSHPNPGI